MAASFLFDFPSVLHVNRYHLKECFSVREQSKGHGILLSDARSFPLKPSRASFKKKACMYHVCEQTTGTHALRTPSVICKGQPVSGTPDCVWHWPTVITAQGGCSGRSCESVIVVFHPRLVRHLRLVNGAVPAAWSARHTGRSRWLRAPPTAAAPRPLPLSLSRAADKRG